MTAAAVPPCGAFLQWWLIGMEPHKTKGYGRHFHWQPCPMYCLPTHRNSWVDVSTWEKLLNMKCCLLYMASMEYIKCRKKYMTIRMKTYVHCLNIDFVCKKGSILDITTRGDFLGKLYRLIGMWERERERLSCWLQWYIWLVWQHKIQDGMWQYHWKL